MISLKYDINSSGIIIINRESWVISDYGNDMKYYEDCAKLSSYIICVLNGKYIGEALQGCNYNINILLHIPINLTDDAVGPLHNNRYLFGQEMYIGNKSKYLPILHLCKVHFSDEETVSNRYAAIMDSSIWNYFIQYSYERGRIILNESILLKTIGTISNNIKNKLYDLIVAREFADLNARMTREAYLIKFPEGEGHADDVSPFVFHSESAVEQLIEKEFINNPEYEHQTLQQIRCQKWRILLVDDKSSRPMGPHKEIIPGRWDCKLKIIKYWIKEVMRKESEISGIPNKFDIEEKRASDSFKIDKDVNILLEYAETIDEARIALKRKKYDIILLDYLLLYENKTTHYGHELLEEISNIDYRKDYKVGPRDKYFFLFISAYSSAVFERLLAEGLNQNEKYWFIAVGACPTNTPQLFLYNLIKLMERRLDDSGIMKLSSREIYKLVNKVFKPKGETDTGDSVRKRANLYYQEVLSLQYHYRSILSDVEIPFGNGSNIFDTKGSVLMTNFIQEKINLGGLLEHLTQLVHLTAFGTIRQWPEMWEEYIYFKALFEKQLETDGFKEYQKLFDDIETHILQLKSKQL